MPVVNIADRRSPLSAPSSRRRADIDVQRILDEIADADAERSVQLSSWRSFYNLAMPNRQGFDQQQPGQPRIPQEAFDSYPIRSTRRGCGNLIGALTPPEQEWSEVAAGPDVPDARREAFSKGCEEITKRIFAGLGISRFGTESHSMCMDLMASMGFMRIDTGTRADPFKVRAIGLQECYPVAGPDGEIENVHRKYQCRVGFLEREWPTIQLSARLQSLKARTPRAKVEIVEATVYDPEEKAFRFCVIDPDSKTVMYEGEPEQTSPWITPRLYTRPGDVYGCGPGIEALPAMRVLNKMVESTLIAGARVARPPMLMATQTGLNPHTIRLSPNAVGMIDLTNLAALGGSAPFWQLPTGSPEWAEMSADQLRRLIDDIMFATEVVGPAEDLKGVTAFAVSVRRQQLLLQQGVDLGRIQHEYPFAVMRRCVSIEARLGLIPPSVNIDNRLFTVRYKGPLAKAQDAERANGVLTAVSSMRAALGDQATTLGIKVEDVASTVGEMWPDFPSSLVRDDQERGAMQQQAAQIAAAKMTQGAPSLEPISLDQGVA